MNKKDLKQNLISKFDFSAWKGVLDEIFSASSIEYFSHEVSIDAKLIKSGGQIGTIRLNDGRSLAIFKFEVADNINISRNRKGLRDIAAKYVDQSLIHGALVFFYSEEQIDYRLTFIAKQTSFNDEGQLVKTETAPKRYTFLLGANEACTTATNRLYELYERSRKNGSVYLADVTEAFSVERLNKDFFDGYKKQYKKFLDTLSDTKQHRDYVKKLLGRIVFLHFLQKKGWMGVPATSDNWIGGDKNYLANLVDKYNGNSRLLSDVLEPLFFNTLNKSRTGDLVDSVLGDNIKIPYLNGGLFDKDNLDELDIDFPYDYFKDLMDFFSQYNFTIDENDPDDSEVGIDPEMLGHIFENLLEDNKDKGAFYTPKEIVQYMSRESVIQYLLAHITKDLSLNNGVEQIRDLINRQRVSEELQDSTNAKQIYQLLTDVKVCDPAIGSGAFPMGVLNVLYHTRHLLHAFAYPKKDFVSVDVKRDIIQNNIYGVDIEQGAVDIARLRFWLALVVDEEIPQPLPNLDYKIMQGNSLLESFMGYDLSRFLPVNKVGKTNKVAIKTASENDRQSRIVFEDEQDSISEIQRLIRLYFSPQKQKETLKQEIGKKVKEYIMICGGNTPSLNEAVENIDDNNKPFFLWHLFFADVFQEGGFDIVIANPPYGAKLSKSEKEIYKKLYSDVHMRTPETYCYFISLACRLALKTNGIITYIVPNNMFYQNENLKTRELLVLNNRLVRAINLGDNTFENADVPTCIFTAITGKAKGNYGIAYSDYRAYNVKNIEWWKQIDTLEVEMLKNVPSLVLGIPKKDIEILNVIKQNGVTIDSIAEEMASGISTGGDKVFRISEQKAQELLFEKEPLHKVLVGAEIDKYSIENTNHFIIYSIKQANIPQYSYIYEYLEPHEKQLSQKRETRQGKLPWWCLHWPRNSQLFTDPKIIMRQTSDSIRCVYDDNGYFTLDSILVLKKNTEKFCYKYIATVLNSKLTDYLYKNLTQEEGRTFAQVKPANVRKLYIPNASAQEQKLLADLYDYMEYLRSDKSHQIHSTISNLFIGDFFEKIINGCVYELFFRSHMKEREINIIEYLLSIIVPLEDDSQQNASTILTVFEKLYKTDNPVRTRLNLFVSRSPEYLQNIIQR